MVITTIPAPLPDPNDKNAYITNLYRNILLFDNERAGSVYVPGVMGAGKSTLLMNMFTQDIQNGHGGLFLDPSGDTIPTILSLLPENRLKDVILIEPGVMANPIGLNLLARTNNATL